MPPPTTEDPFGVDDVGRSIHADASGVQLSWKVVGAILALFIGSGAVWTTLGLAKLDDLNDHNKAAGAHPILYESLSNQIVKSARITNDALKTQGEAIKAIQDSIFNDRAARLADKAADRIRSRDKAKDVRASVQAKALYNLRNGKPIDDGLDKDLIY